MAELTGAALLQRLYEIRERIAGAAALSGRAADSVTLVAAVKGRTTAQVATVLTVGVTHVGHNYVQEAAAMKPQVAAAGTWHLIGHLQSNKAGKAVELFDRVDTIAAAGTAAALARRVPDGAAPLPVLIEVNIAAEPSKSGIAPELAEDLLLALQQMPSLHCLGLMAMPPPGVADDGRRWFARTRELSETLRAATGSALPVLSMGMSSDFEAAIAEGATEVRLGTVLFGPRGRTAAA